MNDLYVELLDPATTDEDPVACAECAEPLSPDSVLLVGTMEGLSPACSRCAKRAMTHAKKIGQNVHDRREDPEKLLADCAALLVRARVLFPESAPLLDRINRR